MSDWIVIQSPTDAEMSAVQGKYLVADNLPIEDAALIAAAPDLLAALEQVTQYHNIMAKFEPDTHDAIIAALTKVRNP